MAFKQPDPDKNLLFYGDNLEVLRESIATESVDLVYLDPPFNSNRAYSVMFKDKSGHESQAQMEAFDDTWTWTHESEALFVDLLNTSATPNRVKDALEAFRRLLGDNDVLAYLVMMTARLVELHRVLRPTGSVYLHCDPTASHYLKILLDSIFGSWNYRNEIIWSYGGRGAKAVARQFPRNHDVILAYSKQQGLQTYNRQFLTRVLTQDEARARSFRIDEEGRWFKTAPRGDYTDTSIEGLDREGRIHWTRSGKARVKYFLRTDTSGRVMEDVLIGDVWSDIPDAMHMGNERLGYPTQKPIKLLERIVNAASEPGALVLDPFCGCGTAIDAAEKLNRRWIGIDVTTLAIDLIDARLRHTYGETIRDTYEILGIPRDVEGARALFGRSPFEFERWCVMQLDGQPNEKQVGDKGIDGVIRFPIDAKGNSDRILVSVKGGSTNPGDVRDLIGTIESQGACMGVFVSMNEPTRGMLDAANHSGTYRHPSNGQSFPKVQIISVAGLLAGQRPLMPPTLLPYFQAQPRVKVEESERLF